MPALEMTPFRLKMRPPLVVDGARDRIGKWDSVSVG
ncbi:Uncharacterised protein [Agrobacterium tumefaciens]|nr:Uncharacterised protein [Agrobacterium tumefaciens]